jgi:nitroreductase
VEFLRAVGSRRSIRWFEPNRPVAAEAIQRILEAARLTGCPGNLQPWRAIVVVQADLEDGLRDRLVDAGNRQRAHEQAPVWIYWFADPAAFAPSAFLDQVSLGLRVGSLATGAGWSESAARAAIQEGVPAPMGMPPLDQLVHGLPPEIGGLIAAQETVGAITVATLAAVDEGLGTCLHSAAAPSHQAEIKEILGVPTSFLVSWLQLLGHPAERPEAGGQRPRQPFEELFASMRWGTPLSRDPEVTRMLEDEGLIQPAAPLPGRADELMALAQRFGYTAHERNHV